MFSDSIVSFGHKEIQGLSANLAADIARLSQNVGLAVKTVARYCYDNREESFIAESDTGKKWATAYEQGYGETDQILRVSFPTLLSDCFTDWVPFADDSIVSLVAALKSVADTGISTSWLIEHMSDLKEGCFESENEQDDRGY